jgi:hypothetical protein
MPPLAFLKGNNEADARLLATDGSRGPDKANPTKVARACRASAQTMEARPVTSSRMFQDVQSVWGQMPWGSPRAGKHLFRRDVKSVFTRIVGENGLRMRKCLGKSRRC